MPCAMWKQDTNKRFVSLCIFNYLGKPNSATFCRKCQQCLRIPRSETLVLFLTCSERWIKATRSISTLRDLKWTESFITRLRYAQTSEELKMLADASFSLNCYIIFVCGLRVGHFAGSWLIDICLNFYRI